MRARDHLERKRSRERQRRERDRRRAEYAGSRAYLRSLLSPLLFALALGLGGLLSGPVGELLLMRPATLEQVVILGNRTLEADAIAAQAGIERGRSLASIDPEAVREAVAAEPWVESARVLRLPSGTLVISVVERDAIARWRVDAQSEPVLVDGHGQRFAGQPEPGRALPLVQGRNQSGHELPPEVIALLGEIERHSSLAADPASITLHLPELARAEGDEQAGSEAGFVLQVGSEGPRALLGRRLLSQRVARLAVILDSEEPVISSAGWIDLRYADRAVLRTESVSG
jgi:cell division septal protein FtsQ